MRAFSCMTAGSIQLTVILENVLDAGGAGEWRSTTKCTPPLYLRYTRVRESASACYAEKLAWCLQYKDIPRNYWKPPLINRITDLYVLGTSREFIDEWGQDSRPSEHLMQIYSWVWSSGKTEKQCVYSVQDLFWNYVYEAQSNHVRLLRVLRKSWEGSVPIRKVFWILSENTMDAFKCPNRSFCLTVWLRVCQSTRCKYNLWLDEGAKWQVADQRLANLISADEAFALSRWVPFNCLLGCVPCSVLEATI